MTELLWVKIIDDNTVMTRKSPSQLSESDYLDPEVVPEEAQS